MDESGHATCLVLEAGICTPLVDAVSISMSSCTNAGDSSYLMLQAPFLLQPFAEPSLTCASSQKVQKVLEVALILRDDTARLVKSPGRAFGNCGSVL